MKDWKEEVGLVEYEARPAIRKLEEELRKDGIMMIDMDRGTTRNIRFAVISKPEVFHDMSNHSVYRHSGMIQRVYQPAKDGDPVIIKPVNTEQWMLKVIRPAVLDILKAKEDGHD